MNGIGSKTKYIMAISNILCKLVIVGIVALIFTFYFLDINRGYLKQGYLELNESYDEATLEKQLGSDGYLVWSPQCMISDVDPWDVSIHRHINITKQVNCADNSLLTYIEPRKNVENVLIVNKALIYQYKNDIDDILCCYSVITRITENYTHHTVDADKRYSLSRCKYFKSETNLKNTTEFIFVKCFNEYRKVVYSNVHAAIPILPRIMKTLPQSTTHNATTEKLKSKERKLSVMLMGIDSVSRLSFQRAMPNALKFVQRNKWIELKGYNKIGLNTFPNLLAVLNGQYISENLKKCSVVDSRKSENLCPLIWDDYKKKGYITVYAEDSPDISTFNYLKVGFVEQPTDYYLRPMMLAGKKLLAASKHPACLGPESSVDHILSYAKNFTRTFKDFPFFGLFWTNGFTHDNINLHSAVDSPLTDFLIDLENIGTYKNTLVVLFSDHGMRFGPIRNTFVGYYEDHLPFIFIWVPEWFREKHPKKYENLLMNQNRLTTPFDLFLTLKEVIDENIKSELEACPKCVSLFEETPWNRSCEDAAIEKKYCMCSSFRKINVTEALSMEVGKYLHQFIVNQTRELLIKNSLDEKICANRTFSKLIRGFESVRNEERFFLFKNDGTKIREYVIVIESNPGPALFEAKIEVKRIESIRKFRIMILDSVNRLDSYAKTSYCVNTVPLKQLCHCV